MTLVLALSRLPKGEVFSSIKNRVSGIEYIDHDSPKEDIQRLIDLKEDGRVLFKRRLEQIDGVAQAIITGGLEREILIQIEPVKLNSLNLTFDEVSSALNSANLNMPTVR